jgi:hypothetical protein
VLNPVIKFLAGIIKQMSATLPYLRPGYSSLEKDVKMHKFLAAGVTVLALSGCAMTSGVMDTGNGTYMVSAAAAPIRGGAAGANGVAYSDANAFCQAKGQHAVVIQATSRDVYQASIGGNSAGFGGGVFAAGNSDLHFKCG